jgi:hypothetical protein
LTFILPQVYKPSRFIKIIKADKSCPGENSAASVMKQTNPLQQGEENAEDENAL